jgi:hypothetical protein
MEEIMFWTPIALSILAIVALSVIAGMVISGAKRRHDSEDTPVIPTPDDIY